MSWREIDDQAIRDRYTELVVQYEALNEQYDQTLDYGQRVVLNKRIDKLRSEIEVLDNYLEKRDNPDLLEKIHYINFTKIVYKFKRLLEVWGRKGGAFVLVLQDSHAMAGDLLVKRLKDELSGQASEFKYFPVGFSGDNELNEMGLLRRLSKYLGVDNESNNIDELLTIVVERICDSLQTRSVVFLEITQWHNLPSQEKVQAKVFSWLCDEFYPKLAAKLSEAVSKKLWRRVYIFMLVVSDEDLPEECMQMTCPFLHEEQDIAGGKSKKIFEVSLENWSREDIEYWLEFTGLPDEQLEDKASRLYRRGRNGIPLIVRDAIEKEFCSA